MLFCLNTIVYFFVLALSGVFYCVFSASSLAIMAVWELLS